MQPTFGTNTVLTKLDSKRFCREHMDNLNTPRHSLNRVQEQIQAYNWFIQSENGYSVFVYVV